MNIPETDIYGWQQAQILANRRALFVLWAVKTMFCTRLSDFLTHYKTTRDEMQPMLDRLVVQGFLQQDGENYVLTRLGEDTVQYLGTLDISQFAHPERFGDEVETRFAARPSAASRWQSLTASGIGEAPAYIQAQAIQQFWEGREQDRGKPEAALVELPFIMQLVNLGWDYLPGDTGAPESTRRSSFREVIIEQHLLDVLPEINRDEETGEIWLTGQHLENALAELKRMFTGHSQSLMATNEDATRLLLEGAYIPGDQRLHGGKTQKIRYIDFDPANLRKNKFLVVNQFRVDLAGVHYIVPDIVLFVNGIPLVVIECKSPDLTNPVEEGITQLLRYAGRQAGTTLDTENQAASALFYFNQLLISTCFFQARFAALGASYEQFQEWKDPYPITLPDLAQRLGTSEPSSQQTLIQGMLAPSHLLDLLYNFTLFRSSGGRTTKIVARYHQFRAVHKAIARLQDGIERRQRGEDNPRGGIIWHTQGSGKSLTMVFLVRKMRTIDKLRNFKIVFVTDRTELQKQLRETARLTAETPHTANNIRDLEPLLAPQGPNLIFAMIQKYQGRRRSEYRAEDEDAYSPEDEEIRDDDDQADPDIHEMNPQENILVIVDEAHRSQARKLHANLCKAMPHCARIAFTGTPILRGENKKTHEIFGSFIDEYTIKQSELDGATLPILYEGRETYIDITQRELLDATHEQIIKPLNHFVRETLRDHYETYREILEAPNLIKTKARDMLMHYAINVLPNGFKAMIVAVSRLAAIRYRDALEAARDELVTQLDQLPAEQRNLSEEQIERLDVDDETRQLIRIYPMRDTLRELEFAAVVSPSSRDLNDDRVDWSRWTNEQQNERNVENFKKPLNHHTNSGEGSPLAFLCVRSMLITGFDAPIVQALYLDRSIKDHELLQAIARVNRTYANKTSGLVVDYFGIANNLKEALQAYTQEHVQGAMTSIEDEFPLLADRHRRVMAIFQSRQLSIYNQVDECVNLLKSLKIRSDFEAKFKKFVESLDTVLPRPQGLDFIADAQQLGLINKSAAATYRDEQLNLIPIGNKVRRLIDEHIDALKIRQRIEPISILDEHFEQKLKRHQSDETNAAEMEHFARAYISQHYEQEDPAYYHKLSERLDAIVQALHENWSRRVSELEAFIHEMRQPRRIDKTGLNPLTERPFLGILEEEVEKGSQRFGIPADSSGERHLTDDQLQELAGFTRALVQSIRDEIKGDDDFWLGSQKQERLRRSIGQMLTLEGKGLLEPYTRSSEVAGRLVLLAHALTPRLRDE